MDFLTELVLVVEILATFGYGYVIFKILSSVIASVLVVAVSWIVILLDAFFRLFGGSMQFLSFLILLIGVCGWWLIIKDSLKHVGGGVL